MMFIHRISNFTVKVVGICILWFSGYANAQQTLFEIELNSRFDSSLPTCTFDGQKLYFYGEALCLIDKAEKKAWGLPEFSLNLPKLRPAYLRGLAISSKDGRIVAIYASTFGLDHQDQVLSALKTKFGKPTKEQNEALQNGFGAKFLGKNAYWRLAGATLTFHGVSGERDFGNITLESDEYTQILRNWKQASANATLKP